MKTRTTTLKEENIFHQVFSKEGYSEEIKAIFYSNVKPKSNDRKS